MIDETVTESVRRLDQRGPSVLPDDPVDLDPSTLLKLADSSLRRLVELMAVADHAGLRQALVQITHSGPGVASSEW